MKIVYSNPNQEGLLKLNSLADQIVRTKNAFKEALSPKHNGRYGDGLKLSELLLEDRDFGEAERLMASRAGHSSPVKRKATRGAGVFKSSAGGMQAEQARGTPIASNPESPTKPLQDVHSEPSTSLTLSSQRSQLSLHPASSTSAALDNALSEPNTPSSLFISPEASSADISLDRSSSRQPAPPKNAQAHPPHPPLVSSLDLEVPNAGNVLARLNARFGGRQRRSSAGEGVVTPRTARALATGVLTRDPAPPGAGAARVRRSSLTGPTLTPTASHAPGSTVSLLAAALAGTVVSPTSKGSRRPALMNRSAHSETGAPMSHHNHPSKRAVSPLKGMAKALAGTEAVAVELGATLLGTTNMQGALRLHRDANDIDGPGMGWVEVAADPQPEKSPDRTSNQRRSATPLRRCYGNGGLTLRPAPPPIVHGPVNLSVNRALAQPGVIMGALARRSSCTGATPAAANGSGGGSGGSGGGAKPVQEASVKGAGVSAAALLRTNSLRR